MMNMEGSRKGDLGKTECWYIIDCEEGAEMIFGHNAKTGEGLATKINEGKWAELLRQCMSSQATSSLFRAVRFTRWARASLVLETQQNSDTTYRVYDYDRRDAEGNLRDLHL